MTSRRPDARSGASTAGRHDDLLTQIVSGAVDQDYVVAAQRRPLSGGGGHVRTQLIAVLAAFGIMIGVSAMKTEQDQPAQIAERNQLIEQIHSRQNRLNALHAELSLLETDVRARQGLLAQNVASDSQLTERLSTLGMTAGTVATMGPGVSVTVDDAPGSSSGLGGVVLDSDLQLLVSGLWQAGAEGVAINGNRLTSLSSIRFAGRAITVNYRSLSPPYVVEAVGDPDTLPARLTETEAGRVWLGLQANFGIRFDIESSQKVTLPADPHDHVLYARMGGGR